MYVKVNEGLGSALDKGQKNDRAFLRECKGEDIYGATFADWIYKGLFTMGQRGGISVGRSITHPRIMRKLGII